MGGDSNDRGLVVEVVLLQGDLQLVEVGREDLLGEERLGLSLVLDFKGNPVVLDVALGGAELLLCSEKGVVVAQSEKAKGESDGVPPVGLHLDTA